MYSVLAIANGTVDSINTFVEDGWDEDFDEHQAALDNFKEVVAHYVQLHTGEALTDKLFDSIMYEGGVYIHPTITIQLVNHDNY